MRHYGDITKINGADLPLVDIITGGSPCQDLSVAGRREGLAGERSGLFMEQIRIVKEQRNESIRQLRMRGADVDLRLVQPRYMVWENVPGAFSSNKGEDFRCVLEEICRVTDQTAAVPMPEKGKWSSSGCIMGDGWSVAWRVHDAQFWGVPQRRKRISLVADFGGESAPEILFECESLQGDLEQSGEERKGSAGAAIQSIKESGDGVEPILLESNQNHATVQTEGISTALPASMGMGGGYVPMIAGTLDASYYKGQGERAGIERDVVCVGNGQLQQARLSDKVGALNCMHDQQAVLVKGVDVYNQTLTGDVSASLTAACGGTNTSGGKVLAIDRASFNQGKNAQYDFSVQEELAQTLVAKGPGG